MAAVVAVTSDELYSLSRPASSLPDAALSRNDDDDDDGLRDEDDDDDAGVLGGANARPFDAKSDRTATEGIDWRIVCVVSLLRIWFGQPYRQGYKEIMFNDVLFGGRRLVVLEEKIVLIPPHLKTHT